MRPSLTPQVRKMLKKTMAMKKMEHQLANQNLLQDQQRLRLNLLSAESD
jgi:hypothetical protein